MKIKDQIQFQAVESSNEHTNLALLWATGCGKTAGALKCCLADEGRVLIVVAETSHVNTWKREIETFAPSLNAEIVLYHSLHKYKDESFKWIILDEAHHMFSDLRISRLEEINFERFILLTATLTYQEQVLVRDLLGSYYKYEIPLSVAISQGILPEPKVYIVPVIPDRLNYSEEIVMVKGNKLEWEKKTCKWSKRYDFMKAHKNLHLTVKCTEEQKLKYMNDQMEFAKQRYYQLRAAWAKNQWMRRGSERKRFIADIKTKTVKTLLDKLGDKRLICFAGSVPQVKELGGSRSVHSKLTKKTCDKIIDNFNSKKTNRIFAVGKLRESVNLVDIEAGIITQLDNQARSFIQMSGRVYRGQSPVQYVLYVPGSQDETYLKNAFEGFDSSYVYHLESVNEVE
jgi:superfamily II DNA or RNA helicase